MSRQDNEPKEVPIELSDNEDEPEVEDAAVSGDDPPAGDPPDETADSRTAALQAQIDQLTQERSTLLDQLLRRQAEFENYRRRVDRERAETYARSRAEVVLELLPVIDNFERALASLEHSGNDAKSLQEGIELIHRQLNDALAKFGLEPVEAVGQTFDPTIHEAVSAEPSEEHEENTVIAEFQRGYKLGEKLLRPAKVKVASTPEK
ncbi:MAG TPA: nucleotide exchange factor GrpE [Blastocatellia bacterium]|nr:nucleotide exchange factor GrpE [Blastocatellia bacterium]